MEGLRQTKKGSSGGPQLPPHAPNPTLGIPAHLQGEVSLADIHSGLAVVGVQVEQGVICRGGGVSVGGEGGGEAGWNVTEQAYPGSR